jgi:hypothetical protein
VDNTTRQSDPNLFDEFVLPSSMYTDNDVPILLNQCVLSYNMMYEHRSEKVYKIEDGTIYPLFIGFTTPFLVEHADISVSNYSRIMTTLQSMNCILQVRRGNKAIESEWALLHRPTYEAFVGYKYREGVKQRVRKSTLQKQVQDLYNITRELRTELDQLKRGKVDGKA